MFNAFSPLNGGALGTYKYVSESPFDLDAGLDFTRMPTGHAVYPFPVMLGYVEGFIPLCNDLQLSMMKGRTPYGPWVGDKTVLPEMVFPNIMGSLAKVQG